MAMIAAAARRNRRASRHRFSGKYYLLILFIAVVVLTACVPYFIGVQQLSETSTFLDAWLAPQAIQQQVRAENPITTEIQDAVPQEKTVNPSYHVVFSTSCTAQQHWESYVFFYHCMRVRQPGSITRVASGCSEQDTIDAQQFHDKHIAPMAVQSTQSFELHLTPDYSHVRLAEGKFAYKYMNKPYGLRHWMENNMQLGWTDDNTTITSPYFDVKQQQHRDLLNGIVILMDPDMILLKPIGHDFSDDNELWVEKPAVTMVTHGNPISQHDGYLNNEWMKLNFTHITGDPSVKPPAWSEGPVHWNTGPPYLATMSDMYKIVSLWTETAPRVLDVYPKLFAEMYGFIIATVMLKLPFAMTQSIVVSTTSASDREGWSFVDALPDREICRIPVAATSSSAMDLAVLPTGLHYCKRYMLGKVCHRMCCGVVDVFYFTEQSSVYFRQAIVGLLSMRALF
jgi:peptidyl serine alpha-galactosyltransferase